MAAVSIGKLVRNKEFAPLLSRVITLLDSPLTVEDPSGAVLIATGEGERSTRFPVSAGGEVIGWVYGPDKTSLLAALLTQQADSELEKRSLVNETLNKYKEITLLYDMVEKVSTCLDTREVARLVIEEARKILKLSAVAVFLLNRETDAMEVIAHHGLAEGALTTIRRGQGITGAIWAQGRAEIVNDVVSDPRFLDMGQKVHSMMCAPLKAKEEVIGLLRLGSADELAYTAEDLKLFNTLATLAAVAIENANLYEQLKEAFYTTVYTLAETIEKRDPYTGNHTKRVMEYSLAIGRTLGLAEEDMSRLQLSAVLHDIGKIGIRDSVLLKEGPLDDEEFAQIKMHTIYGEEIISRIKELKSAIPGIKQHHEKVNGRGYPLGLSGEEIDVTARIIAVADSFDAMTTDRPYRKGLTLDQAFDELRKWSGSQFDPAIVDAFFESDVMEAIFAANSRTKILL